MEQKAFNALQTNLSISDFSEMDTTAIFEKPKYNNINGVAIIPVKGVISKDVSEIEKFFFDIFDLNDLNEMIVSANNDNDVKAILLDINSPGGGCLGLEATFDLIYNSKKPVISFSDSMVCSAAYHLGSAASACYGTRGSEWGSIGVYCAILDSSEFYRMNGYKMVVIKNDAGDGKAAGMDGTSLTPEQTAMFQKHVDDNYALFIGDISKNRRIKPEALKGQTFYGLEAKENGFCDSIVTSIEQAIIDANRLANYFGQK